MGIGVQPKQFEFFLASLMSHAQAVVDLDESQEAEFWATPPLTYFEQRLQLVVARVRVPLVEDATLSSM